MAATLKELQELHKIVAKSLTTRIAQDMEDMLPTDAATLGAAIKFLKDNNVSADPADAEDLTGLRDKLTQQMQERSKRRGNALEAAKGDITLKGELQSKGLGTLWELLTGTSTSTNVSGATYQRPGPGPGLESLA